MACDGCLLQTLAGFYPLATTEVTIWHARDGQPDRVQLSLTHKGEQLAVTDETCRGAVAKMLQEMDAKRVGDCRVILED